MNLGEAMDKYNMAIKKNSRRQQSKKIQPDETQQLEIEKKVEKEIDKNDQRDIEGISEQTGKKTASGEATGNEGEHYFPLLGL